MSQRFVRPITMMFSRVTSGVRGGNLNHDVKHVKNPASIDGPEFKLIGKRQENYLNSWIHDWAGADMKVLLSQTVFSHVSTHKS